MGVTEKEGEFNETGGCCGGAWRCGEPPKSIAPLTAVSGPPWLPAVLTATAAAAWAAVTHDVAGWKESAVNGETPKLAAAAHAAAAAAWAAEAESG